MMPGESLGNHASPILLLILKMSVLRKAIFLTLEDSLSFALIADSRSKVLHDAVPFCKVVCSWFLELLYHSFGELSFNL